MTSSTNPPSSIKKFQFETDFEQEEELHRQDALRGHEPAAVAPTFSEADLERASNEAFQKGYILAQDESKQALENALVGLTERLLFGLGHLLEQEEARLLQAREIALRVAFAGIKKFWPQLLRAHSAELVEEILRQSMEMNPEEKRIVVRVHDTLLDHVVTRLPQLKEAQAFQGKVIVLSDDVVLPGDCKIEWADGGMERLSRTMSAQLDHALDRLLAGLPPHPNESSDERTTS